jgi:predicted AAA+ superfamily ATPase
MMIKRDAEQKLIELAEGFPAVSVVGPRQSGKTTLVRSVFPEKPYVLLEDPDTRAFAEEDPRSFLAQFEKTGAIIDEVQRVPQLFSYLQGVLDRYNRPGHFILTGSQNFLMMESISQSLAGRVGIIRLLPLSMRELFFEGIVKKSISIPAFFPACMVQRSILQIFIHRISRHILNGICTS